MEIKLHRIEHVFGSTLSRGSIAHRPAQKFATILFLCGVEISVDANIYWSDRTKKALKDYHHGKICSLMTRKEDYPTVRGKNLAWHLLEEEKIRFSGGAGEGYSQVSFLKPEGFLTEAFVFYKILEGGWPELFDSWGRPEADE